MNRIAIQRCCSTPVFLTQYETSTDAVFRTLGIDLVDIDGFGCCGYPLKNYNFDAYLLSSGRNIALAESEGLHILTFCNGCFASLARANLHLKNNEDTRTRINRLMAEEGFCFEGKSTIKHLLHYLYYDVSFSKLRWSIKYRFDGLKVATHYGCQILRPREVVFPGSSSFPPFFDRLVELTGATSIDWSRQPDCCGAPLLGINMGLSGALMKRKIKSAIDFGAEVLCVACPFCQLQFDTMQYQLMEKDELDEVLPCLLYTQLLGLAMELPPDVLGIDKNLISPSAVERFL